MPPLLRVPFVKVAELEPDLQKKIARNFSAIESYVNGETTMKLRIPYKDFPELSPRAAAELRRDFMEIEGALEDCTCGGGGAGYTSDTFDRSTRSLSLDPTDGALGGASTIWLVVSGTWQIIAPTSHGTNVAANNGSNPATYNRIYNQVQHTQQKVSVTFDVVPSVNGFFGVLGRMSDNDNYYGAVAYRTGGGVSGVYLFKMVAGVETALAGGFTSSTSFGAGDTVSLVCDGTTIKLQKNGSDVLTATDSSHTTGTLTGMLSWANTGTGGPGAKVYDYKSSNVDGTFA